MNHFSTLRCTATLFCALIWLPNLLHAQLNVSIAPTNVSCFGAANGQAKANPVGGVPPYNYAWSNNGTTQTILNLSPGTYTVTVKDANQNSKTAIATITQPPQLGVTAFSSGQICANNPDGVASAVPYGGTPAYHYLWSNGETTPQILNLSYGTYTVTVTDANSCIATDSTVVTFFNEGIWLNTIVTNPFCGYDNGQAHVSAMSGIGPYAYLWSNGGSTSDIENLAEGTYTVTVSDVSTGCSASATLHLYSEIPPLEMISIPTPFCINQIATFIHENTPIYPDVLWSLDDSLDQIVSGQGTDTIQVQWASTGAKTVNLTTGINGVFCTQTIYLLNVAVCANAIEPWFAAASVSPNPFSDFVQVAFPAGAPVRAAAVLMDVSGKILLERILSDGTDLLPTSNLPAGIYLFKIKTQHSERVWKLTKK